MSEKIPQDSFIVSAKPVAATSDALSSDDWAKVGIGVLCLVVGVVLMTATPASFPGALLLALGCVVFCATATPQDDDACFAKDFMSMNGMIV